MVQRHVTRTFDFPNTEPCLIAVLSDTHGRPHSNLFPLLKARRPGLILHAGDIGEYRLINDLEGIGATIYVRGNVDPAGPEWPDSVSLRLALGSARLDLLLLHIAVARLRLNKTASDLLDQEPAQVVIFGHSHMPFLGMDGKVCLFNPGSAGPARWGLPTTLGLIEMASPDRLMFKHLDLLTGEEWKPGSAKDS